MTDAEPDTILVGVDLSSPPFLSPPLLRQLSSFEILLFGWKEIPDQTSPGQARREYEEEAREVLDSVAVSLQEEGVAVRSELVFTPDRFDAIERAAAEEACDAVLIPHASMDIRRLLLSLRGLINADRIARVTGRLAGEGTDVTMLHVAEGSEEPEDADRTLLEEAVHLLVREGIDERRIDRRSVREESPAKGVSETAQQGDLVVIGESTPTGGRALLSSRSERIAREVPAPVLIVRYAHDEGRTDPATRSVGRQAEG